MNSTKKNKRPERRSPGIFEKLSQRRFYTAKTYTREEEQKKLGKIFAKSSKSRKTTGNGLILI